MEGAFCPQNVDVVFFHLCIMRRIFRSMVHLSNTFDIDPPIDQHTSMDGEDIPGALQDPLQPL